MSSRASIALHKTVKDVMALSRGQNDRVASGQITRKERMMLKKKSQFNVTFAMIENCDGFIKKILFLLCFDILQLVHFSLTHFIVFRALVERKVKLCVISSYTFRNKKKSQARKLFARRLNNWFRQSARPISFYFALAWIAVCHEKTH